MIKVQVSINIERPMDDVFDYLSDFENNPEWQSGMKSAQFTTEPPLRIGSTYNQLASMMGRSIESTFEVIAYEPGKSVKATTTSGSFPITFHRMVEPFEGGTRVNAIIEGEAKGFFKIAEPLLALMVRKSIEKDYANLKQILESTE